MLSPKTESAIWGNIMWGLWIVCFLVPEGLLLHSLEGIRNSPWHSHLDLHHSPGRFIPGQKSKAQQPHNAPTVQSRLESSQLTPKIKTVTLPAMVPPKHPSGTLKSTVTHLAPIECTWSDTSRTSHARTTWRQDGLLEVLSHCTYIAFTLQSTCTYLVANTHVRKTRFYFNHHWCLLCQEEIPSHHITYVSKWWPTRGTCCVQSTTKVFDFFSPTILFSWN